MYQSVSKTVCCINPNCSYPNAQPWGNKFCNSCGTALKLNDRYVPLQRLGSGGFAQIYTVWDLQKQREQVIKVLVETSPKALQLFEQEAAVLASLNYPGIPRVEKDGYFHVKLAAPPERLLPCLVMEKINGQTLEDLLEEHRQGLPESSVQHLLYQALEILAELHNHGIIHRDIKPSNLMLRQETGQLVAIDFGGAKQVGSLPRRYQGSSTRLISPGYSPPEQMTGEAVGPQADFYALGKTMIQLLTGQDLGNLQDPDTEEFQWRNRAVVSLDFGDLLDEMTQVDPQQRPANVVEIEKRLDIGSSLKQQFTPGLVSLAKSLVGAIATVGSGVTTMVVFVFKVFAGVLIACLDTTWEMVLGGLGAAFGTAAGFTLLNINWAPVQAIIMDLLGQVMWLKFPAFPVSGWQEIIVFALAGLGTSLGITMGGGFRQEYRPLVAGILGFLGYGIGGITWQALVSEAAAPGLLGSSSALAVFILVLGLGLPTHEIVHALVAATGTGLVLAGLVWLNSSLLEAIINFSLSQASLFELMVSASYFCVLGIVMGFWIGVSYYLLVPVLRWLGWR
ncbi:MAG: serine/threonine-protein kinase [Coleofasciculaceae cyanobacterium]